MGKIGWIASYPKSGNTWVRLFLHHVIRQINKQPLEDNDLAALDRTSKAVYARTDLFNRFLKKPHIDADIIELAKVRTKVCRAIAAENSGLTMAKTHTVLGEINGHPLIDPKSSAGGIYIVRNPLDVAVSLAAHMGQEPKEAIRHMGSSRNASAPKENAAQELWASWSDHVRSWTEDPMPGFLIVRYEDIHASPREMLGGIAEYLRIGATPGHIDEAVRLSSFDAVQKREADKGFAEASKKAERFFRAGQTGKFADVLTPEQIASVKAMHREQMDRFGYLPQ